MTDAATLALDAVGTVAVVDLEAACELFGRDMLPYPLGRSRPVGSVWLVTRAVGSIADRLHDDLRGVRAWVEAYVRADVCVECRVSFSDSGTPDLRVHGLRAGESGFVAVQRNDRDGVDVVDIYSVAPETLGAVIADSVGLIGSGSHACIAVTGYGDRLPAPVVTTEEYDEFGFLMPHTEQRGPAVLAVDGRDVVSTGTVQSRSEPAQQWGVDTEREVLQLVQVGDDGDYIYAPDGAGYAEPLDAEILRGCIDGFIADDLEAARARRRLT